MRFCLDWPRWRPKLVRSNGYIHTWLRQSKMQHHQFDTVLIDWLSETFLQLQYIFNAFNHHVGLCASDQNRLLDLCSILPAQGSKFASLRPSGVRMSSQGTSTRFGVAFGILWALGEHHCRELRALWRATQLGSVATFPSQWQNGYKSSGRACKLLGSFGAVRQQPQPYGRNSCFHTEVGCIIQ